jgi:hypothetical protein
MSAKDRFALGLLGDRAMRLATTASCSYSADSGLTTSAYLAIAPAPQNVIRIAVVAAARERDDAAVEQLLHP